MKRHVQVARKLGDEATATAFTRELMEVFLQMPEDASAPLLGAAAAELFQKYYHLDPDRYREEKVQSNQFVMERLDQIRAQVTASADPVLAALRFAILGNYIDFSALQGEVSFSLLDKMLQDALEMEVPMEPYAQLRQDLAQGKTLLYLTDNAGEICFDRVLAEEIQRAYPHLQITFCVRGGPANNDATREDAAVVGIPFPVIDNGTCIGGTALSKISPEARRAMDTADIILSKGQGNIETLFGCGYNIYYAFLIKCERFMRQFDKPKLTNMLVRERDYRQ